MKALRRSQTSSSSTSSSSHNSSPSPSTSSSSSSSWVQLRSALFVVTSSSPASCSSIPSDRARLKSPWSRRKRKSTLSPQQWNSLFTSEGRLRSGGVKFLKKVRSGGVDPSIRAEVWPFLLGVYDLNSTREEREVIRTKQRREYEKLRRQCRRQLKCSSYSFNVSYLSGENNQDDARSCVQDLDSSSSDDVDSARESLSSEERNPEVEDSDDPSTTLFDGDNASRQIAINDNSALNSESSDSESSEEPDGIQVSSISEGRGENDDGREENDNDVPTEESVSPARTELNAELWSNEDFATWQRIIRVDAVRDNPEWAPFSQSQTVVSESRARRSAQTVGLKDFDHLEPGRIYHAARLVAILEAYAMYDPEIGYCQGMSDLLSPIITVITEDHEAFWCFVGFMKKARHNFRLDEVGIRRQLGIVSKIIKYKDSHFFRHLEKLQAEDCFFVYRMVVVLFRRELTFEQTICLWEVMWADQAAIRAGIGKSAWSRIRQRAPPTDDLLLYAIAASVLQKRKLIIEKYSSMDEILRECNSMSGQLDVWKLLDDAHNLVMNLHDKIETSLE